MYSFLRVHPYFAWSDSVIRLSRLHPSVNETPYRFASVPERGKHLRLILVHSQGFRSPEGVGDTQQGCAHATFANNTPLEMAKQNLATK